MIMPYSMLVGHLKHTYRCPICHRRFKGNGYFNHFAACKRTSRSTLPSNPDAHRIRPDKPL